LAQFKKITGQARVDSLLLTLMAALGILGW